MEIYSSGMGWSSSRKKVWPAPLSSRPEYRYRPGCSGSDSTRTRRTLRHQGWVYLRVRISPWLRDPDCPVRRSREMVRNGPPEPWPISSPMMLNPVPPASSPWREYSASTYTGGLNWRTLVREVGFRSLGSYRVRAPRSVLIPAGFSHPPDLGVVPGGWTGPPARRAGPGRSAPACGDPRLKSR